MDWLKEHVYLAAWLALPVMVIIALIQGRATTGTTVKRESLPLKKSLTYLLFLICFPITLTPWVESGVRVFCGFASVALFIVILSMSEKLWNA